MKEARLRSVRSLLLLLLCCLLNVSLANDEDLEFWNKIAEEQLRLHIERTARKHDTKRPKNIILFIGDGMGISSVTGARAQKGFKEKRKHMTKNFFFEDFGFTGFVMTSSNSHHVSDSAAGAVALTAGWKVDNDYFLNKPGEACTTATVPKLPVVTTTSTSTTTTSTTTTTTPTTTSTTTTTTTTAAEVTTTIAEAATTSVKNSLTNSTTNQTEKEDSAKRRIQRELSVKNLEDVAKEFRDYDDGVKNNEIHDGIAELSMNKGMKAGLVTTMSVTHATPGAIYGQGTTRFFENDQQSQANQKCTDVAKQLTREYPGKNLTLALGGGLEHFIPVERGGKRIFGQFDDLLMQWKMLDLTEEKRLELLMKFANNASMGQDFSREVVLTAEALAKIDVNSTEQVLGLFQDNHIGAYYLSKDDTKIPRLKDMATKAVELMEAKTKHNNNTNTEGHGGYFLMIEGGNIDWFEHTNRLNLVFDEIWEFDEAIKAVREMTNPEETLILVTADHAHSVTITGKVPKTESILWHTQEEHEYSEPRKDGLKSGPMPGILFATGPGFDSPWNYTKEQMNDPEFAFPSYNYVKYAVHGGEQVGIWADGPMARLFSGSYDNTHVAYYMKYLLCLIDRPIIHMAGGKSESYKDTPLTFCDFWKEYGEKQPKKNTTKASSTSKSKSLLLLSLIILVSFTSATAVIFFVMIRYRAQRVALSSVRSFTSFTRGPAPPLDPPPPLPVHSSESKPKDSVSKESGGSEAAPPPTSPETKV